MTLGLALLVFLTGGGFLVWAGVVLASAGDELAERTGLGRLFVGMLIMALATSLPELATDVVAAQAGAPDIAVGDLFGSSMANMAILAVIDLRHRGRVWARVELGQARVASIAIGLTALATVAILTPPGVALGWVGIDTIAIAGGYVAAVAWIHRSPISRRANASVLPRPLGIADESERSFASVIGRLALGIAVVLGSAPAVAYAGREIATAGGLSEGFVGTSLVAVSTSLPELVTALAAVRISAYDLAVGNLLGSNAVNMALLVLVDLAYTPGPVLAAVSPSQAVAGVGAILLVSLALTVIVHGAETRLAKLEPDALLLLATYGGLLFAVWRVGG